MNKVSCDVIQDLLPLYVDNICSEHTKDIVEEHLADCESCQTTYEALRENTPEIVIPLEKGAPTDDEKFIQKLKRDYSFRRQMSICGILALIILIAIVLSYPSRGGAHSIFENFFLSISADKVTVSEMYELENGNIFVTLESDRDVSNCSLPTDRFPKGNEYESGENAWSEVSFYQSFLGIHDQKELRKNSYVFARETVNYLNNKRVVHKRSSLYYRGKFNTKKVIWEEGQRLPAAPEEIEKLVQENYNEIYQNNIDPETYIAPAQQNVDMYITDFRYLFY